MNKNSRQTLNVEENRMNVAQLVEKLNRAHNLQGQERRAAYGETLEVAKQLFPDFAGAAEKHKGQLLSQEHVNPLETSEREVFEQVFEEVPGLSRAYGAMTAQLYAESRQPVLSLPASIEYWGMEIRCDSNLGRQL